MVDVVVEQLHVCEEHVPLLDRANNFERLSHGQPMMQSLVYSIVLAIVAALRLIQHNLFTRGEKKNQKKVLIKKKIIHGLLPANILFLNSKRTADHVKKDAETEQS